MQLTHMINSSVHSCITSIGPGPISYSLKVHSQSPKLNEKTSHQDCGFRFFLDKLLHYQIRCVWPCREEEALCGCCF